MDEHLLDTNILSKIFYGNNDVKNFVDNLAVGIETIVYRMYSRIDFQFGQTPH